MKIESYRDLVVWQRAMELVESVYGLTAGLPADEKFALSSQIKRAVVSVPANISEGHGRNSRRDYIRFLSIANGSLKELETLLLIANRLNWLDRDTLRPVWQSMQEVGKMLRALIESLSSPNP